MLKHFKYFVKICFLVIYEVNIDLKASVNKHRD